MLLEIHIKNIAVIDEVTITFDRGLHTLTGETGAGKSILIDAINMALGSRAAKDLVRTGTEFAVVDLVFSISDALASKLSELGIELEDDTLIISRRISAEGKSSSRINGSPVPLATVRQVGELLINIHGQNDNQAILSADSHMRMLDYFGKNDDILSAYALVYKKRQEILSEIKNLEQSDAEAARRLDLLKFQIDEIDGAKLRIGEDAELEERRKLLANMENIMEGVSGAYRSLYGEDNMTSGYDLISDATRDLGGIKDYDKALSEYYETLEGVLADVEDITHGLKSYLDKMNFEDGELDIVEGRLAIISNLKRKYGATIEDITEYYNKIVKEMDNLVNSEETLARLRKDLDETEKELSSLAEDLTRARMSAAKELGERVYKELCDLDMQKMRFEVSVTPKLTEENEIKYTSDGKDHIEFMISANPGEALKPLIKIASGGEMSRIMLAIKSVLTNSEDAECLIFDEIDTGVSGRAAQKIAEKMASLAKARQVLCITHLAQIASMADIHYLIEKTSEDDYTATTVKVIDGEERKAELARIIGGVRVTDITLSAAEEMLSLANAFKEGVM